MAQGEKCDMLFNDQWKEKFENNILLGISLMLFLWDYVVENVMIWLWYYDSNQSRKFFMLFTISLCLLTELLNSPFLTENYVYRFMRLWLYIVVVLSDIPLSVVIVDNIVFWSFKIEEEVLGYCMLE